MEIKGLTLEVKGVEYVLSIDEAKTLYYELHKIFGKPSYFPYPNNDNPWHYPAISFSGNPNPDSHKCI